MNFARRQFLQAMTALMVGSQICMNQSQMAYAGDSYGQNLSKKSRRKLALLIGINQYEAKTEWLPLNGCVNDVELQRELLIHRFGFNPKDILTLTDRQATRVNIIEGIREHLTSQALLDDLVVVHFSGHGSRLKGKDSLVPVDGRYGAANEIVNDLTVESLLLLLGAIATDKITCILDAGYSSGGNPTLGNFRIRARPNRREWELSSDEIALRQEFSPVPQFTGGLEDGNSSHIVSNQSETVLANKSVAKLPPKFTSKPITLLKAATKEQICIDANWEGFSSGFFTYSLTQQLWKMTGDTSLYTILGNVISDSDRLALASKEVVSQEKEEQSKQLRSLLTHSLTDTFGSSGQLADAFIKSVSSDRRSGEAWLGGIPIIPMSYYGSGSVFTVADDLGSSDSAPDLIQVRSHNGIITKIEPMAVGQLLQVGAFLREKIRVIQRHIPLSVALDIELTKIEQVDATSAISGLDSAIAVTATEQYADCLFGSQASSYGLFSVGRTPILGAFGAVGESIGAAIRRLQFQLESLLAAKLIHLTANQNSSLLAIKVSLEVTSPNRAKMVVQQSTDRDHTDKNSNPDISSESNFFNKCLTVGDRLSCKLENLTDEILYVIIFSFDSRGKVMTPSFVTSPYANDISIAPKGTLIIPQPIAPFEWTVSAPQGLVDVQIIASRSPMTETMKLLDRFSRASPVGLVSVSDPLEVAKALLQDLHSQNSSYPNISDDAWVLDLKNWATLGFTYRVA